MNELMQRMLAAWPDAKRRPPDMTRIQMTGEGDDRRIMYTGAGLPPPFHRGMRLGSSTGDVEEAATALHVLITRTSKVCDRMSGMADQMFAHAHRSRMRIITYAPYSISVRKDGTFDLDVRVEVEMMGDTGRIEIVTHQVGDTWTGRTGWRRMAIDANAQDARRRNAGRMLRTDPVMAACLARMTDGQRGRLVDLLHENPRVPRDLAGWTGDGNWNKATLSLRQTAVDPDIETMKVKHGVVIGRVRLADGVTWNAGTMIVKGHAFPDIVMQDMVGRPLREVVDHVLIGTDVCVQRAWMDRTGAMRIRAGYEEVEIG